MNKIVKNKKGNVIRMGTCVTFLCSVKILLQVVAVRNLIFSRYIVSHILQ